MFFDAQAVLFTFVVLSPSFRKVKTKNEAVLMCAKKPFLFLALPVVSGSFEMKVHRGMFHP